ncbi:type 1 glutamine amidotransferase, partial [Pseudanabaenaceae cyanobacterium LEGE 13415]|nr:type 1 glutamine amidotransferase [Pseudanabaenaceae cyanobacterium LEGE 13415]
MRVHYLQHVPFEGLGSIATWMTKQNHLLSCIRLYANDPLPAVDDFDWLIVLGGPMNIDEEEQYPWLIVEKQLIKQAIEQKKIVLGICLGAQLIADALGAKVYAGQHKEIGWFPIRTTEAVQQSHALGFLPAQLTVFHWHGDTFELPEKATRLAYSEACLNQAFLYNEKVLGLQFHLEMNRQSVQQIIENCASE